MGGKLQIKVEKSSNFEKGNRTINGKKEGRAGRDNESTPGAAGQKILGFSARMINTVHYILMNFLPQTCRLMGL
jgi:hypothetical protein